MENKETLEEIAKKTYPHHPFISVETTNKKRKAFVKGYELAQQQGYSEEEMQEYAEFCIRCYNEGLPCIVAKDWVKQFKKK